MRIVKKREEEIKVIPTLSLWKCKTCKTPRMENCIVETSWRKDLSTYIHYCGNSSIPYSIE